MTKTKTHILIAVLLFVPALAMATSAPNTYEGTKGMLDFINDFVTDIWSLWDTDIPEFITRFFAWFVEYYTLLKLKIELETIKFAWEVSKNIIDNFQIGSRIAAAASALPQDMQAALVDMRAFDAVNVVINALVTRYVMRFV
ncbi:DUF2523 family protein [Pseudoalteromonas piscicida]